MTDDCLDTASRKTPEARSPEALALLADKARIAFDESVVPVPSPCISVCKMTEDRSLCLGCWRSLDEIRVWSRSDADERRVIWDRLLQRAGIPR